MKNGQYQGQNGDTYQNSQSTDHPSPVKPKRTSLFGLRSDSFDPLKNDVRDMHDRLVNRIFLAAIIIAPLIIISNIRQLSQDGREHILIIQVLIFSCAISAYVFRSRIPFVRRALGILLIMFFLGVGSLYSWGLIGGGIPSLMILCIFSTVFLGRRAGLIFLILSLLSLTVTGVLVVKGILVFDIDFDRESRSFITWLIVVISFLVYVGLTVMALGSQQIRITSFIDKLRQRATEMEEAKVRLEHEISERKIIEEQFLQSQKMEAIGRLAGGVAHDFNNHLMVIMNLTEKIRSSFSQEDRRQKPAAMVLSASKKSADLTRQLLAFSRKQFAEPKIINLNSALREIAPMLESITQENIELKIEEAQNLGNIRIDRVHLEQIILNLIVNAKDAMPSGGRLTIETDDVVLDESYAEKHLSITPGYHVMLAVSDTGQGMDKETRSHIFEPFFTTKSKDQGTGLGLATVYGIVKQAQGDIFVYSELDKGTTFKIFLPRVDDSEDTRDIPVEQAALFKGNGQTILVVEDEDLVRATAVDMLTSNGYRVIEAKNGEAAVELFEKHMESIHMVLTDVIMADMDGMGLAEKIDAISPNMKFLYISGYPENVIATHGVLKPGIDFLPKPFSTAALLVKVRNILNEE